MNRKDILELRKRFTKESATFTKFSVCFVDYNKDILMKSTESFLTLNDEELFKYLEIAKKVLSGSIGNSLLKLDFSNKLDNSGDIQTSLFKLKKSKLKDDILINQLYKSIIENYDYDENYIIILFHDIYDILKKAKDNKFLDESEEIFEYIICAICPVKLSKPALSYFKDENTIKSRIQDWIIEMPINGFVYPAFIDRSSDVNSIIYYTKNTKNIHKELMEDVLACSKKETIRIQREKFKTVITESITDDAEEAENIYLDVQNNLRHLISNEEAIQSPLENNKITLDKEKLEEVLKDSNLSDEKIQIVKSFYKESFDKSIPEIESLLDKKAIERVNFRKKELNLKKEIKNLKDTIKTIDPTLPTDADIIINASPEKIDKIKTKMIDGEEYILIPIEGESFDLNKTI